MNYQLPVPHTERGNDSSGPQKRSEMTKPVGGPFHEAGGGQYQDVDRP